jgi:prophage regulatory protein
MHRAKERPRRGARPQRFLRIDEVIDRVGLRTTQIYQLISEGRFPKQVRISNRIVAWVEDEVIAYQNACIAERDRKQSK